MLLDQYRGSRSESVDTFGRTYVEHVVDQPTILGDLGEMVPSISDDQFDVAQ